MRISSNLNYLHNLVPFKKNKNNQKQSGIQTPVPCLNILFLILHPKETYFQKHMFLTGCQIHFVFIVVHTQIHNICKQLFIANNHLQLLLQRLEKKRRILVNQLHWQKTVTTKLEECYFNTFAKHQATCKKTIKAYLCYLVVVGKEHGKVLRFLNGLRICHFPQELSGSLKTEEKTVWTVARTVF